MLRRTFSICAIVLLSFACSRETAPALQKSNEEPADGGTLIRRLTTDIETLNPLLATTANERYVYKYLYTPIIYLDRDLIPVAGLAKSWTISADGRVYRFELDERATFSDGTSVRASDVLFTLRQIANPANHAPQIAGFFEELDLERSRIVGEHTIEFAFRKPLAGQLIHFADVYVLPNHVYAEGDFRRDFNDVATGSGPYKLIRRSAGEIVLERRSDYWRERPHIQTVVFKVVGDHATAWNALKIGQLDETIISSDTWLRDRSNPELTRAIDFRNFYTLNYNFIAWNNRHPLLADKRVRRALAMCIPIDAIVRDVYHGTARAMTGPFTLAESAFNPAVPRLRYDPAEAKRILASTGWLDGDGDGLLEKEGRPFALEMLIMPGSAPVAQFAQIVQAELRKAGVRLAIRTIDGAAQVQQIRAGNFQSAYLGWELDADPDPHALFHSSQFPPRGQNFVFYSNPEADRLIDAARRELDPSKRNALFRTLHEILADDQPYNWTSQVSAKWATSKRLQGVAASEAYGLFNWYPGELSWWIAPDPQRQQH